MHLRVAIAVACAAGPPAAAAFLPYSPSFRTVSAPAPAPGSFGVAGAALSDGRLVAMTGSSFFVETAVGSGAFALAATLDPAVTPGTDPGFLALSPDGTRLALGAGFGRPVVTFDTALLSATGPSTITTANAGVFAVDHFAGAWMDNSTLALSGASGVTAIDTLTGSTTVLVGNVGGASAGVTIDQNGRLYTGNGFDLAPGGSVTGEIRAFDPADYTGGPADFETGGTFIAEILSASPLHLDVMGHLVAAGGDFSGGDNGYVGVFNLTTGEIARLDPSGTGSAFYSAFVNHATGELVVQNGSEWFIYAPVPAPGAAALGLVAAAFCGRSRRAS